MKLHYSPISPYVRKVRVFAMETGIHDRLELVTEDFSPVNLEVDVFQDIISAVSLTKIYRFY